MLKGLSAIVFLPDDSSKTGYPRPLMLSKVLGAPLLAWLSDALYDSGVGRFFLVCHERFVAEACACLPKEAEVMTTADANAADLLHVFLSTADESEELVTILAGPAVFCPLLASRSGSPKAAPAYRADREQLMTALDEDFYFPRFLRDNCAVLSDFDGFFTVDSPAAALNLADRLRRDRMLRLMKQGVEIYDADSCYIEPTVRIETGARLLPGTMLKGSSIIRSGSVIGPWSVVENAEIGERSVINASQVYNSKVASDVQVGPYAHLRDGAQLGRGVKIGNFVEVKNSTLGENTWASHLSYLGDAEIGERCNFGCGTVTVNYDRVEKHKTTVEDDSFIGCNSSLIAPLHIGKGSYIAAGTTVTEDVPDHALAIARIRQSHKKEWSLRHKRPKE
ncbi:MAG: hypothetical protein IJA48_01900 [Oscillospiraceae bacterium]|nr:hypothetical protein [Oscillospiraceae bacterium]